MIIQQITSTDDFATALKKINDWEQAQANKRKVFKMRDATPEEQESIDKYIKSISKPTGINFWDLDDNDDCISRKAVLSILADHFDNPFDMVRELPPVAISYDGDLISRQDVLAKSWEVKFDGKYIQVVDVGDILDAPSVDIPPEHDGCKDCKYESENAYSCKFCKQNYKDMWEKKPHWIEVDDMIYECSECGSEEIGKSNFCPNCGMKMN